MKFLIALFALIAAASAGYISNYALDAPVLSVHETHAPLITTLHHHGAAIAPAAAVAYHAPAFGYHAPAAAVYSAPAYGYENGYGYDLAAWRKKH